MPRIFLIDDDEMVSQVTTELLDMMGHEVLTAASGEEALEVAAREAATVDLVLLDLTLPDISGHDLLPQLLAIRSDLKVVLCSGSVADDELLAGQNPGFVGVLPKPFDVAALKDAIERYSS